MLTRRDRHHPAGTGGAGYSLSKREVARFVHDLALTLAPESIRVNAVHPGNVNTNMLHNPVDVQGLPARPR